MDSGNSESMQSSSGGDDESAFLSSHHPPPPLPSPVIQTHHQNRLSSTIFDPLLNFFDPSSPRPFCDTNPLNLEMMWSRNLRSNQNPQDLSGLIPSSSSGLAFVADDKLPGNNSKNGDNPFPSDQCKKEAIVSNGRNSKKRPRASRRAPTTVLSTDTSNFRAMVQEFTGIPAPPFSPSYFPRSRLDLFASSSSSLRSGNLEPSPPPFLLRPFPLRGPVINPPSTSLIPGIIASSATINSSMQNPVLNFQPLLQSPPRYPLSNFASSGSKAQVCPAMPPDNTHLKMGILEELGLSHNHGGSEFRGFPNTQSPNLTSSSREKVSQPPAKWNGADQRLLRPVNDDDRNRRVRYTASSSEFHADKTPARSEGMVESWIYSSD